MHTIRLAAFTALVFGALSTSSWAGLVLLAGPDEGSFAVNNYGFSGTYYDLRGKNGSSEDVAHPGGGPVAFLYVFSNNGGISTYFDSTAGPYDGSDDTQVAVLNLSSKSIASLTLTSTTDIFGFDNDGISSSTYGAPGNAIDKTTYGGPQTYFTAMNTAQTSGTMNFIGGLAANGGTTYFSLEEAPTLASAPAPPPVPEPSSLIMAGCGVMMALGYSRHRRRSGHAL